MKTLTGLKMIVIGLALWLFLGPQAWAQEKPNFDKIVPEDVYCYFSIEDMSQYNEVIKKSCLNDLWNDPEVQRFIDKAWELMQKEFAEEVTTDTGITIKDITSLADVFKGQIAFILDSVELKPYKKKIERYVLDGEGQLVFDENDIPQQEEVEIDSTKPVFHLLLLARVTQNKEKLETFIEKSCTALAEEEIYKQQEDYRNVSYFTFYKKKESLRLSYGYMDDIFFVAYGEKGLKRVIDNAKGEAVMPLSNHSAYKKIMVEIGPNNLSTGFINCVPIASVLKRAYLSFMQENSSAYGCPAPAEATDKNQETFDNIISFSGLGDLRTIVGASRQEGNGLLSISFLHIPGAKRGLWKLLASSTTQEFKTIKAVPKDNMLYMGLGFSLTELWDEIMNILPQVMPKEQFDGVLAKVDEFQEELGLKIKEDILSVIGKEIALVEDINPDYDPANPAAGGMIPMKVGFIVTLADEAKARQVHNHFMESMAEEQGEEALPVKKQYGGFTFHIIEMPVSQEEKIELMGYFFTKEFFVFAMPGGYLKEIADALSGKNKGSLLTDPDFTQLITQAKVDTGKTLAAYVDYNRFIDFYYSMLQTFTTYAKEIAQDLGIPTEEEPAVSEKDELLKLIPKLETLKKYFSQCKAYSTIYPTADGIKAKSFIRIITE